jgi:calcium-dependent protein kinase
VCAAYTFGRELGWGQFGVTYLATHKASGARRAWKSTAARNLAHASDAEDVRREVQIMHHLMGHRNIVELHGAYEDRHSVNLAMELCEGGEPVLPRLPARLGKSAEEDVQAVEARRPATTRDRSRHSS